MNTDKQCAKDCYCEFYFDLAEKHPVLNVPTYQELYKQQNNKACFERTKNFCRSALFQSIKKDFHKNYD